MHLLPKFLLDQELVAISVIDASGTVVDSNDALWTLLGWDARPSQAVNALEFIHPDDVDQASEQWSQLFTGQLESLAREKRYVRRDGTVFWGRLRASLFPQAPGDEPLLLGILDDVSDRYEAMERLVGTLEGQARFVASIGHEIRTPLHAILGFSELLTANASQDEAGQRLAASVYREARSLRVLIDDLLDYSKAGAGEMKLYPVVFSPSKMAAGAVESVKSDAAEANLSILIDVEADVPLQVLGDELRIRQIVLNLLSNAIKYTEEGGITVTIRRGKGDTVVFAVEDTGIGIPAEALATLFDPFTQAHQAKSAAMGTGLGLAISGRLAELLGDGLRVTSTEGVGSKFSFDAHLPATEAVAVAEPNAELPRDSQDGLHVLLVEDSPVNQLLAASQLGKLGATHDLAETGPAGLDMATRGTYDIVLLDWHLPGMDGLEVAENIRLMETQQGRTRIPIVAVTARGMAGDRESVLAAGMDDLLRKPVALADLEAMLTKWTGHGETGGAEGQAEAPTMAELTVLDLEVLESLRSDLGDPSVIDAVVATFLSELPKRRADLTDGLAANDHELVRRAAHTLKSTAAMLGATELAALCREAEAAAANNPLALADLVGRIEISAPATEAALQNEVAVKQGSTP